MELISMSHLIEIVAENLETVQKLFALFVTKGQLYTTIHTIPVD